MYITGKGKEVDYVEGYAWSMVAETLNAKKAIMMITQGVCEEECQEKGAARAKEIIAELGLQKKDIKTIEELFLPEDEKTEL
jgi:hypothetical protein